MQELNFKNFNGMDLKTNNGKFSELRHLIIYGYTRSELSKVLSHFERLLPNNITMNLHCKQELAKVTLIGYDDSIEFLRFTLNKLQRTIAELFKEEVLSLEDLSVPEILGNKLKENELNVSIAESCTGGNIAHKIVQQSGSSAYFLGSIVSYSNDVKANVLNVNRSYIDNYGAVSQEVVESMAKGVSELMHTDCSIATSGIAGPDGGTPYKPVGTVWMAVKCKNVIISDCKHFKGKRNDVIEAATIHSMVMLIKYLRDNFAIEEDLTDE